MPETQLTHSTRRSGIELLKIAAILLIVISHITQTMNAPNPDIAYSGYLIDLDSATRSLQTFVLILFRHFGVLGNTVFFICSAWFLLESDKFRKKKWFFMLSEIWFVSVVILYDKTLRRPFKTVSGKVYELIKSVYLKPESLIIN